MLDFKIRGYDVHFLTGTDEHGLKIDREAKKKTKNFLTSFQKLRQQKSLI